MTFALLALAAVVLGASAIAMALRNLIHSALLLVAAWAGIGGFYLWAGAEFVAFAQVLVYVGAVSMVVLFAILLTPSSQAESALQSDSVKRAVSGLVVGGGVFGIVAASILNAPLTTSAHAPAPVITVKSIGEQLMGPHAAAVLIVAVLLTVALLGAIVIASVDRPNPAD
jgi:NADH:ubiquinone oxidoreductase subunit 6 (subunit J)